MRSPGINGEGELRRQSATPGSHGKMAVKTVCVYVCVNSFQSTLIDWVGLPGQKPSGWVRSKVQTRFPICLGEHCGLPAGFRAELQPPKGFHYFQHSGWPLL